MALKDGYGCTHGIFKFLVVGLDVRRMNEVCYLIVLYIDQGLSIQNCCRPVYIDQIAGSWLTHGQ